MDFDKIEQMVVVRQKASLDRCTHQRLVYIQLAPIIPSPLYFYILAPLVSTLFPPFPSPPNLLLLQPWEEPSQVALFVLVGKTPAVIVPSLLAKTLCLW